MRDPLRLIAKYPLQTSVDGVIKIFHELARLCLVGYEKPSLLIRADGNSIVVSFTLKMEGDTPPAAMPLRLVLYAADPHGMKIEAFDGVVCIDALDLGNDPTTNYGSAVLPGDPAAPSVVELRETAREFAIEMAEQHSIFIDHVSEEPRLMRLAA